MKAVEQSLNYCYLFTMAIIELRVFTQFKLTLVTLLLFIVVVLNLKNCFDFYVIVVKNDCYAHFDLDCYQYGNC